MKNEVADSEISEMVSIKSKQYAYVTKQDLESKKLKGVKKNVVKRDINFQDYKDCVFNKLRSLSSRKESKHTILKFTQYRRKI